MDKCIALATSDDVKSIFEWRQAVAHIIPLDSSLPLDPPDSDEELKDIFKSLTQWMLFWKVLDDTGNPVGWFEMDSNGEASKIGRIQGWVKPLDRKRRWLRANALYEILQDVFWKRNFQRVETSLSVTQRDLIEAYFLAGFQTEGLRPGYDYSRYPGKSHCLVQLSISDTQFTHSTGVWVFGRRCQ